MDEPGVLGRSHHELGRLNFGSGGLNEAPLVDFNGTVVVGLPSRLGHSSAGDRRDRLAVVAR